MMETNKGGGHGEIATPLLPIPPTCNMTTVDEGGNGNSMTDAHSISSVGEGSGYSNNKQLNKEAMAESNESRSHEEMAYELAPSSSNMTTGDEDAHGITMTVAYSISSLDERNEYSSNVQMSEL